MTPSQWVIAAAAITVIAIAAARRRALAGLLRAELHAPGEAINLAVFRILLFGTVLIQEPVPDLYAAMPRELLALPRGWGWARGLIPMDPDAAAVAKWTFLAFAASGLVGFLSRTSAAVVAILGIYAYGMHQAFGKLTHLHHFLWFAALLAVSRCGDALAVDAVLARRRNPGLGPPAPAIGYARPLRLAWVLMSLVYVFPGFWKVWTCGFRWAGAENIRNTMHLRWNELGGFLPPFRIDHHPALCTAGGVATLLFELAFPVAVLLPRARPLIAAGGLLFHVSNRLFMGILFWPILVFYATFVDWAAMGRRLRALAGATPATGSSSAPRPPAGPAPRERLGALTAIGAILIAGNVACGLAKVDSWPFTVYPRFDSLPLPKRARVELEVAGAGGEVRAIPLTRIGPLSADKASRQLQGIAAIADPAERTRRLRDVWTTLAADDPSLAAARTATFFLVERWIDPDQPREPLSRVPLAELRLRGP